MLSPFNVVSQDADVEWFEANPLRRNRLRPPAPDEWPSFAGRCPAGHAPVTAVRRLSKDLIAKVPGWLPLLGTDDEAASGRLFDVAWSLASPAHPAPPEMPFTGRA